MIRNFKIGDFIDETLLVVSSEIKFTKDQKPYLLMYLTDGYDTIKAKFWEYKNNFSISKNTIVDVSAVVKDWQGIKELNVKKIDINESKHIYDFAPKGNFNINEYLNVKLPNLIEKINNTYLRDIVYKAFMDNINLWKVIPAAQKNHHAYVGGNLKHSVDVVEKAKALADVIQNANSDLCIAGGLLQDFRKLWTYYFDGATIEITNEGRMLNHIVIGIRELEKYRNVENSKVMDLLQHIIASHHSKLEWGSPTTPLFMEAWIVAADMRMEVINEMSNKIEGDYLEKTHILDGNINFSISYVDRIMNG